MKYARIGMLTSIICLIVAISLYPLSTPLLRWAKTITRRTPVPPLNSTSSIATGKAQSSLHSTSTMPRTPVYFLSHGGPNIMEDYDHPAYSKLQEIGKEITQKVRPKAVVVFSAHWQASRNSIEVNTADKSLPLNYDYFGFPEHYYSVQYPNIGSKEISSQVLGALKEAGIDAKGVSRGLDHGVFAPFTVAFNPESNPLKVPLVQVSLFDSDDADQHYRLGEAMQGLRDEGILIIVSGMAVHNLRDMWKAMQRPAPMPYSLSFDAALKEAAEQKVCLTLSTYSDDENKLTVNTARKKAEGYGGLVAQKRCQTGTPVFRAFAAYSHWGWSCWERHRKAALDAASR
jgi:4,5-DOPA dioxygenase extradiol